MGNRIKRTLLCLLAVSTLTVSGNIYADGEDGAVTEAEDTEAGAEGSDEEASGGKAAKLKESE